MYPIMFFGAQSLALGMYCAVSELYPECKIDGFLVSSLKNNPKVLANLSVRDMSEVKDKDFTVLIATPEDIHSEIVSLLETNGFHNYICMDSRKEAILMERYYAQKKIFTSVHSLKMCEEIPKIQVFMAKHWKDRALQKEYIFPAWVRRLQVGATLTTERISRFLDNEGLNISAKNPNYCELTGLYWVWKNQLPKAEADYYGLFHYRRILDITDDDILRLKENNIDVILPYPTMHEPDIKEHHARYVQESDWQAMLQALKELAPEYAEAYDDIFAQEYMYNYNMLVAKRSVLADYCAWLFPILERTEELSVPKGSMRADRYIGYLGENLLTLYFMYHKDDLNIVHTGRIMLT